MKNAFLLFLVAIFTSVNTYASPLKDFSQFEKVGEGDLRVFFFHIYRARLYSENGIYINGKTPIYLELDYKRNVKKKDLLKHTKSELEDLSISHDDVNSLMSSLNEIYIDIKANDKFGVLIKNNRFCSFYHNGSLRGEISNINLCDEFLSIWLSEETSKPRLRKNLIGS